MIKFTLKALALTIAMISKGAYASSTAPYSSLFLGISCNDRGLSITEKYETGLQGDITAREGSIYLDYTDSENQRRIIEIEGGMLSLHKALKGEASDFCSLRSMRTLEESSDIIKIGIASSESSLPVRVGISGNDICIKIILAAHNKIFKIQNGLSTLKMPFVGMHIDSSDNILITKNPLAGALFGTIFSSTENDIFLQIGNKTIWLQKTSDYEGCYNLKNVELISASEDVMSIHTTDIALLSETSYGLPAKVTNNDRDLIIEIVLAAHNQTFRIPYGAGLLKR